MAEYYKFIGDIEELRWCFNNMIPNLQGNPYLSFLMCIATRAKKLSKEEREYYGISGSDGVMMGEEIITSRGPKKDWTFNNFVQHIYKYECNKMGMITKNGLPYPEKTLSVLFHFDPADEVKVANCILSYGQEIQMESIDAQYNAITNGNKDGLKAQMAKIVGLTRKNKSLHAGINFKLPDGRKINTTIKTFIHYDFDIRKDLLDNAEAIKEAENVLHSCGLNLFGKQNFYIVRTKGGFHILAKRSALANVVNILKKCSDEELYNNYGIDKKKEKLNPIYAYIGAVEENYSYTFEDEDKLKEQIFVPLPGTIQYGDFIPYITNKSDFN